MPLKEGFSKATVAHNIRAELQAGRERDQALAIALSKAREASNRRKMWLGGTAGATKQDSDLANQFPERQDTSGTPAGEFEDEQEGEDKQDNGRRYSDGGVIQDTLKEGLKPPHSFSHYKYQLSSPHAEPPTVHAAEFAPGADEQMMHDGDLAELARRLRKKMYKGGVAC